MIVHHSQFPVSVQRQLLDALRLGQVPPRFLYDGDRQTQKWLAVHRAHSPSRIDAGVQSIYEQAFDASLGQAAGESACLVGLGCGGGQKDTRYLAKLKSIYSTIDYVPCDVSQAMTRVAREAAAAELPLERIHPFVCDLANAPDLGQALDGIVSPETKRVFTFFGMIPNLEPAVILPRLAALLREGDRLLLSANLAPGDNYRNGVETVLPQYDNTETRAWLLSFLEGMGVSPAAGQLRFGIEEVDGLLRIVANFKFLNTVRLRVADESVEFAAGRSLRLFYSYRHTEQTLAKRLAKHGLAVADSEIDASAEEGVFRVEWV
ncbi:MAG: L-histidine N(alpha)-methyltransferase [Verrucomicrobia bacterium]|nr:L-histidine N(alpha)-methyltransferase [Verrucomicrobiota bacterium]